MRVYAETNNVEDAVHKLLPPVNNQARKYYESVKPVRTYTQEEIRKQIAQAEIDALKAEFDAWLGKLPAGIASNEEDKKLAQFAERMAEIRKRSEEVRVAEKEPHLKAGRDIDGRWKPIVDAADKARKDILIPSTEYRKARAAEEAKRRTAEVAKQRAEQAKQVEAGEHAAPVSLPPKKPTGLRTVQVVEITSLRDLAEQIATMNEVPSEFVDACRVIARRMLLAGAPVKGARLIEEQRAA
jgi:hypothetical protein